MRPIKVGLVLPVLENPATGEAPSWSRLRNWSKRAEALGFDTVWIPDELLWKVPDWPGPRGFWECVSLSGAVAASTSTIRVGTWVLSALHRNPALTAKVAATLDEISEGRFVFGFGSGHPGGGQAKSFGFPDEKIVSRYEEALEIVIPLLRQGRSDFQGTYHTTSDLDQRPRGPSSGDLSIMLAGHGPRNIGLAVRHADIWSAYSTKSSLPEAFIDRLALVDAACAEQGRDPASLGRSVGVVVEPTGVKGAEEVGLGVPMASSVDEFVESANAFAEFGVTSLEVSPFPDDDESLEALGEMLDQLDRNE